MKSYQTFLTVDVSDGYSRMYTAGYYECIHVLIFSLKNHITMYVSVN